MTAADLPSLSGDVIVTGGAGAIGSRLVRRLLDEPGVEQVTVVDDLSSGFRWLVPKSPRIRFVHANVADGLPPLFTRPIVFHLAAFFANQNSVDYPQSDLMTNGLGTLNVLDHARKLNARRVIYASAGCSIAGHSAEIESASIREDAPVSLKLDTPYQITKALGEFYCCYFDGRGLPTVRARFFNCYGPGEVPGKYRNVIANFVWAALNDLPLTITGTGDETRDFIFVDDLVEGLVRAATYASASGAAINLGTGVETRIADLAQLIVGLTNSKSAIEFAPRREWDRSTHRRACTGLAKLLLDFEAGTSITDGLSKTIGWFSENMDQIRSSGSR